MNTHRKRKNLLFKLLIFDVLSAVFSLFVAECENETNIKIIQEIMGHADITTTMDIYNEATLDKKKESFLNLEGKIKLS